ncbi:glycosyltransferase [Wenzhouxiangella sp. C33]|uniref:Glycosyltransferase n=1 Tax=Wenzhouxiangella limi TaxID=2707351 RepID=A0A845V825_9GAMM|nr:glycosyltransferase [Wenzhouxiangella limi]
MPVYNDWHHISALMDCLARQTLPAEQFEVLLVDNGSDAFQPPEMTATNVRILHCHIPGSYAARNHGIEQARAPWLVFTDADCRPLPEWLSQLLAQVPEPALNTLLAGQVRMIASSAKPGPWEMHDLVKGIPQGWYVQRGYAATANLMVPAELARKLGGFDTARYSGGDADFCRRAVAAGADLRYVEAAVVEHPARTSWPELAAKYRRIKGGQITQGSRRQRLIWTLRTFLPPVIAFYLFLGRTAWPLRYRLVASAVQLRLWVMEMVETMRLLLRHGPQR